MHVLVESRESRVESLSFCARGAPESLSALDFSLSTFCAMTRLCLIRHGETDWNVEKRLQGHLDVPLNAKGRHQAGAAARFLAGEHFAAIYSSDSGRALDTAQEIGQVLGRAVEVMPDLRERHFGCFQGLTQEEARRMNPEAYGRYRAREKDFEIPGGESLGRFAARITGALTEAARAHPGLAVLVVTHGGVLDIAYRLATGKPLSEPRDFTISNATLNWIAFEAGAWRLLAWDENAHLDETLDELPG